MIKTLVRAGLVGALALGGISCGGDDGADSAASTTTTSRANRGNVLSIVSTDYAYDVDGDPDPGHVTIQVSNQGKELHMIAMAKLKPGKTVVDAKAVLENADPNSEESPLGEVTEDETPIDDMGGIQFPGTSYAISSGAVVAGDYLLLCFIPDAQGKPHFALGMVAGFTVSGSDKALGLPDADQTFTISNDGLTGPSSLTAGRTTLLVKNDSDINREINLVKLAAGKTSADFDAYLKASEEADIPDVATAPTEVFAFVFDAAQDRTIAVDLTPGSWLINTPDPERQSTGKPVADDPFVVQITVT